MSEQTDYRNQVEDLFHEAQARPNAEARAAYLDGACQGNPELRAEVEALLSAGSEAGSYFDKPVELAETASITGAVQEGDEVGNYKLLQQLGEGGFGIVYMAQQTQPVRRQVAIKIIKPGMDSKEVIARFEAERQALAMMDHPNIAKVLDAGTTPEGRPYFVMELVKGRPITEYCDANQLNTQDRLRLFVQVCNAVQHAHQKGVIHRDLKPSNVMVTLHDGKPVPKVIDFGVSKALSQQLTDKTLFTRYGQIIGTPQYMSPEQAEMSGLDIDTRSDIYSLGVLLYELLTGQTPFDSETLRKAGLDGMRKLICESEPAKPSTKVKTLEGESATSVASHRSSAATEALSRSFAGDLDWIVMKSLDKDRSRRYETASNFLQDIERHLADEPVHAGPPSFTYQLSKLYRRHRGAFVSTGAIAGTLLLATVVSIAGWAAAAQATAAAQESRQDAVQQTELAQRNEKQAQDSAQAAQLQAQATKREKEKLEETLKLLTSLLSEAAPNRERGLDVRVVDLLAEFSDRLDQESSLDPEVEIAVRVALGKSLMSFDAGDSARLQFTRIEKLQRDLLEPGSLELATFLYKLSSYMPPQKAEALLREAARILKDDGGSNAMLVDVLVTTALSVGNRLYTAENYLLEACKLACTLSPDQMRGTRRNPYLELANNYSLRYNALADQFFQQAEDFAANRSRHDETRRVMQRRFEIALETASHEEAEERLAEYEEVIAAKAWRERILLLQDEAHGASLTNLRKLDPEASAIADEIESQLNIASRTSIDNWSVAKFVGVLYYIGEADRAKRIAERYHSLPGATSIFQTSAHDLMSIGNYDDATKYYDAALARKPAGQHLRWNLAHRGRICAFGHRFEEGVEHLTNAIGEVGQDDSLNDDWSRLGLIMNRALIMRDAKLEEAELEFRRFFEEAKQSDELYGVISAPWILYAGVVSGADEKELSELEATTRNLLSTVSPKTLLGSMTIQLCCESLGEIELRKGNLDAAREFFGRGIWIRRPSDYFHPKEWLIDRVVDILERQKDAATLQSFLNRLVKHSDAYYHENHPERAFVRMRYAEHMLDDDGSDEPIGQMLAEAQRILSHQGEWIADAEHARLKLLIEQASVR